MVPVQRFAVRNAARALLAVPSLRAVFSAALTHRISYGHGFVMPSINRRTVVAVENGHCPSCTRFGAFSSPNHTLSGVAIGRVSTNDNTRVWRSRGPSVAAFR